MTDRSYWNSHGEKTRRERERVRAGTVDDSHGLDRRDKRTITRPDGSTVARDYSYVGSSEMLSRETDAAGDRRTYDYDAAGARLGQDSASGYRPYATDANGSVIGLEQLDVVATVHRARLVADAGPRLAVDPTHDCVRCSSGSTYRGLARE